MTAPRIVTPEEAQRWENDPDHVPFDSLSVYDLAHTVATEPDRTRAAVVKALRYAVTPWTGRVPDSLRTYANAIENGADW